MKYPVFALICGWLLISCATHVKPLEGPAEPFVSDGCSCWPDWDYYDCCYEHDKAYWAGGSPQERKDADRVLKGCVAEKGHPVLAPLMYMGVRIGGHGWLPTPFRWGFGYSWPQGYFEAADQVNETPDDQGQSHDRE